MIAQDHSLIQAMANMREDEAVNVAREMLENGEDPLKVLEASREAMELIGNRFEEGQFPPGADACRRNAENNFCHGAGEIGQERGGFSLR